MTKWFYHLNNIVKGPVSPQELQNLISTFDHPEHTFVWSRGHTDWISADRWQPDIEPEERTFAPVVTSSQNYKSQQNLTPAPPAQTELTEQDTLSGIDIKALQNSVPPTFSNKPADKPTDKPQFYNVSTSQTAENTITSAHNENHSEKFKVQLNFVDQPMMTKDELMAFAARAEDPSQIAIYDTKTQDWKEIYAFKDIVDKLGLTRRKHPRVPILAQFNGTTSRHEKFSARLVTISIGGLGLTDVFDLKIGDLIYGNITSPHFYSPVAIESEVTYCGNDGYVGLKFTQINDDSQSLVTDYVKRFSQNS